MLESNQGIGTTLLMMSLFLIGCQTATPPPAFIDPAPWAAPTKPAETTSATHSKPNTQTHSTPTAAGGVSVNPQVERAIEDLATRQGMDRSQVIVENVETVEWRDSSLGCPQPGMMYAQVITPGFRIVLELDGVRYSYHADLNRRVTLCEDPSPY